MARRPMASSTLAPPPRSLNVQKFAESRVAELEALHAIVARRTGGSFRVHRSKRRRTTSHVDRFSKGRGGTKKRRLGKGRVQTEGPDVEHEEKKKKPNRRVRRRIELQKNLASGYSESGDGTQRLRTHLWHAKRFTMVKRWGFYLPLGLHGRGRGSRAILKQLSSGVLIHDSSYCFPIQLEGPEGSLMTILEKVLVSASSDVRERDSLPVTHGMCYERAMLHHFGAPLSQLIAPVIYMWRPLSRIDINLNNKMTHDSDRNNDPGTLQRQLWIWVHAAAFTEAFDVVSAACREQMNNDGVLLSCVSLKGKLAKLEIMGSEATRMLQKILQCPSGLSSVSKSPSFKSDPCLNGCSSHNKSVIPLEHDGGLSFHENQKDHSFSSQLLRLAEHLPSLAILSLDVMDPRNLSSKRGYELEPALLTPPTDPSCDMPEGISETNKSTLLSSPDADREKVLSFWSNPKEYGASISDSEDLWISDRLQPPIEENILCLEKHYKRLKYFHMDSVDPATLISESQGSSSRTCSLLLLKHDQQTGPHQGWSIILPLSWVKSFWIPLVSLGAHAIGLREKHWVASHGGIPCFPFDFPDCNAYSTLMSVIAAETSQAIERRPPCVRPPRIPIIPPWGCIRDSVKEGFSIMDGLQCVEKNQRHADESTASTSANDSQMQSHVLDSCKNSVLSSQGCVARTSDTLTNFLRSIHSRHLLLFSKTKLGKRSFSELVNKEMIKWVPRILNKLSPDRPLYFTRVLLRPFREGVFEEGAVVCAPIHTDLKILESRLDKPEKLQIPHHLATSYFTQEEDSDKWALQVPEDPSAKLMFRWPIGFVTSGFVRGSAKPVALAVCEVTLLAQLRERQWSEVQEKGGPEVLVLVRNLRSTTYRLSHAALVLEQEGDDLAFA